MAKIDFVVERDEDDQGEHEATPNCWCEPTLEYVCPESGVRVWLHRMIQ